MKCCAVIPAAGSGSRLGLNIPKILAPISDTETIWTTLRQKLLNVVDHIHLIVSPIHENLMRHVLHNDLANGIVSMSIQAHPIGMGDAVFCGYSVWSNAKTILIVWGDQVFVSNETLMTCCLQHAGSEKTLVLPLTHTENPYVEYIFSDNKKLIAVKQSREGDNCFPNGLSDIGTFLLSTHGLKSAWDDYLAQSHHGKYTGEINFLPFLPYLAQHGWDVRVTQVANPLESRGINTLDDLLFFQTLYKETV